MLTNGWKIKERSEENGMHSLMIYVDGQLVDKITSGSLRWLSSIANDRYAVAFRTQNETIHAQPTTKEEKAREIMEEYHVTVTHLRYGQEFTEEMTVEAHHVDNIPFELEMLGYDVLSLNLIEETTKDIEVLETLETAKELDVIPHKAYTVGFTFEQNDKDYHATTKVICANPQKVLYELEKKGYNVCDIHFIEEIGE